jgi:tetratricopeptide (TPR) repeat protein
MKKKASAKVKRVPTKPKKSKVVKGRGKNVAVLPNQPVKRPALADNPLFAQAVQNYEAGLRLMQERKFERARAIFQKVALGPSKELAERVAVHLNAIQQALSRTATNFKSPEEHYDYACALMNQGDYEGAGEHLEKMAKQQPKVDYIWYGLATLNALRGRAEEAMKHLTEAIRLNPSNRIQARNDNDFQNLLDDPRFTELLYPENSEPAPGRKR